MTGIAPDAWFKDLDGESGAAAEPGVGSRSPQGTIGLRRALAVTRTRLRAVGTDRWFLLLLGLLFLVFLMVLLLEPTAGRGGR